MSDPTPQQLADRIDRAVTECRAMINQQNDTLGVKRLAARMGRIEKHLIRLETFLDSRFPDLIVRVTKLEERP